MTESTPPTNFTPQSLQENPNLPSDSDRRVAEHRLKIDEIDHQIVNLLDQRAAVVSKVGHEKSASGDPVFVPTREAEVIRRAIAASNGSLSGGAISAIFTQIIAACRALEKTLAVAYLGPPMTFSHGAARRVFGDSAEYVAVNSIDAIFAQVSRGESDFGVVPIENTAAGMVGDSIDGFMRHSVDVIAETSELIVHNLLSRSSLEEIQIVYSHPQALAQCQDWLSQNLPAAERSEVASTAAAAVRASQEPRSAAIGLEAAATANGLNVVRRNIHDFSANSTRFFLLGSRSNPSTGNDRTAMIFAVKDRVGALHEVLGALRNRDVNLSNMQSRPARGLHDAVLGDYVFYAEFAGHRNDSNVAAAITDVGALCSTVRIIGSWPADLPGAQAT